MDQVDSRRLEISGLGFGAQNLGDQRKEPTPFRFCLEMG